MFGRLCIILLSIMIYSSIGTTLFANISADNSLIPYKIIVDRIALKQREMLDTIVSVQTGGGSGSGTIIDCIDTDEEGVFEYRVLTNAHVTALRFVPYLRGVDFLTGEKETELVDTGCWVVTFNYPKPIGIEWTFNLSKIIFEDVSHDLAILSFTSEKELAIAKQASNDQLQQVRVFDEVFAVGCQLGRAPFPTFGIVAQILMENKNNQEWIIYANTAQIAPGSSGGALYKKYDNHWYLIGIPYSVAVTYNGQIIPHMAYAISLATVSNLIDSTCVSE